MMRDTNSSSLSLILYEISCISCQLNSNPRIIHFNINIYSGIHTFNVKHYQLLYSSIFLPNVCRRQYYFSIHDMRQSNEIDKVKVEFALPFARFELFFSLSLYAFHLEKRFSMDTLHGIYTQHGMESASIAHVIYKSFNGFQLFFQPLNLVDSARVKK